MDGTINVILKLLFYFALEVWFSIVILRLKSDCKDAKAGTHLLCMQHSQIFLR